MLLNAVFSITAEFIKENPQYIPEDNAMQFLSDDGGESYNRCHFWSNFEIGQCDEALFGACR